MMGHIIVNKLLINFIGKNIDVCSIHQGGQRVPVSSGPYCTGGVMGGIDDDGFGAMGKSCLYTVPVGGELRRSELYRYSLCPAHFYVGDIAVVSRFEDDNLVARLQDGHERSIDAIGR